MGKEDALDDWTATSKLMKLYGDWDNGMVHIEWTGDCVNRTLINANLY